MSTATEFRFTGRHMLALMVGGFSIVIAVNITMAILATTSWTGLMAKNGYVASIDYAKDRAARKLAAERGWTVRVEPQGTTLAITASDDGGTVLPLSAVGEAIPADQRDDPVPLTLTPTASGATTAPPLAAGEWAVRFTVGDGEEAIGWRHAIMVRE